MERKVPLQRTPMKRGSADSQLARSPMKRTATRISPVSRTKKRRREQVEGDSMADLRPVLVARCGSRCEWCNHSLTFQGFHAHHRKFRSRGGRDEIVNLVALCTTCHDRAHARPIDAIPAGMSVLATEDPALIPIRRLIGPPAYLTTEGAYSKEPPA